ncbi:2-polyprenyl-3-methyl-6-methoxy-1,4-benzoquinone monooxygenase [Burkholderiaceae bacterium]|nr:2-polyprenyl-3-methyl-6-methoxy-1,4-benzoquinone monooxygenase [Burkholderiaceae bacterium]
MTPTDAVINALDASLRTLFATPFSSRPLGRATRSVVDTTSTVRDDHAPQQAPTPDTLTPEEKRTAGALMRVNHVGEVCAQGLYAAQALGARVFSANNTLAKHFETASQDEADHLAWTAQRLHALDDRPSFLNPLWYAGAFAMGLVAARCGERVSLGFVVATEQQVEAHLAGHLERLPANDHASRAIVQQMKEDEAQHALDAQQSGALPLPQPVQQLMRAAAKVMTTVAHRI